MKTFWCLYRENPFQVLCQGGAFRTPQQDEKLSIRVFPEESDARFIQKRLAIRTFIARRSYIIGRIKSHDYNLC